MRRNATATPRSRRREGGGVEAPTSRRPPPQGAELLLVSGDASRLRSVGRSQLGVAGPRAVERGSGGEPLVLVECMLVVLGRAAHVSAGGGGAAERVVDAAEVDGRPAGGYAASGVGRQAAVQLCRRFRVAEQSRRFGEREERVEGMAVTARASEAVGREAVEQRL